MTFVNCPICQTPVDPAAGTTHPGCAPWADAGENPDAALLKHELMQMILWADRDAPRSRQKMIGPSQIGVVCDRRIGYQVAEIPEVNVDDDPWPAIVGTAIHTWLDAAVTNWNLANSSTRWVTERTLPVTDLITGRGDLFDTHRGVVIDHKGAGSTVMKQVRAQGPKPEHQVQVQLYGLGYLNLGYKVNKVAVIYYPRAGWLRDSYCWVADFDPQVAYDALHRLGEISRTVIGLDVLSNPHRWEQVDAWPGNGCGLCPWYDPGRDSERGADDRGCPGR